MYRSAGIRANSFLYLGFADRVFPELTKSGIDRALTVGYLLKLSDTYSGRN